MTLALAYPANAIALDAQVERWQAQVVEVEQLTDSMTAMPAEHALALLDDLPADALVTQSGADPTGEVASWRTPDGDDVLVVPLDDGLGVSSLAFRWESGKVESITEVFAQVSDEGALDLREWRGGELLATSSLRALSSKLVRQTATTSQSGVPVSTSTTQRLGSASPFSHASSAGAKLNASWHAFSTSRFFSCNEKAGVATWVVGLFFAVCGASGLVTAGTALIGCALGIAGTGGALGACVAYATYW